MSKMTEGPWEFFSENGAIGVLGPKSDVAHCHKLDQSRSKAECEANARAIAALPDLVVALKRLVSLDADAIDELINKELGGDCTIGEAFQVVIREIQARSALAKAGVL